MAKKKVRSRRKNRKKKKMWCSIRQHLIQWQEELPFEIVMSKFQYFNTENIETKIQLADSGYGQGHILVNPLHMACIYTA